MIYSSYEQAQLAMGHSANQLELKPQQVEQYNFYEYQAKKYGQYDPGILANGAHYGPESPFADQGLVCANCVYYANNACEIVAGTIQPQGICKFWIIPEHLLAEKQIDSEQQTQIQDLLMSGMSNEEIMAEMPDISLDDIVAAAEAAARSN